MTNNSEYIPLFVHPKRGKEALRSGDSIMGKLQQVVIHDYLPILVFAGET